MVFIEFRIVDHSSTFCRKKKYLLGHVLQPIDSFSTHATIDEFKTGATNTWEGVFKNYDINNLVDSNEQLFLYWSELKSRQDILSCNFLRTQETMEILSVE